MNLFSELPLSSVLQSNLAKHGFVQPTPVQSKAIPPALAGRDVVATAQTGTGKTLAFVLPLLESLVSGRRRAGIQAIILSPTRELALQIQETYLKLAEGTGIRAACLVGGMNERPQIEAVKRGAQVIIATPGRLEDFLQRKLIQVFFNRFLILDEADRMLDMGFLPSIERIVAALPAERQTLFFSATIEKSVAHLITRYLKDPERIAIGATTEAADRVELHSYEIPKDSKFAMLRHLLDRQEGTFLVFSRTKHGADRLSHQLERAGYRSAAIHGNRTQNQRNHALKGFQSGAFRVLVATDVASRGIHVDGISHVVNFDLPQLPEDFIHRVGRTGRAGQKGIASTFITPGERSEVRRIEKEINARLLRQQVPATITAMDSQPREYARPIQKAASTRGYAESKRPAVSGNNVRPAAHSSKTEGRRESANRPPSRNRRRMAGRAV
jgi:ATP-dependent RNA helicase RhlE